jgi:hypothetical protein
MKAGLSRGPLRPGWLAAAVCVLAAGAALRIGAARGDLWLDEIWSLCLAQSVSSPLDILTRIHHDNNHYLNTLFMFALKPQRGWFWYRIPALLCGIGAIAVSWAIGFKRGAREAFFAALLTAGSCLAINYSSEARGYAAEAMFALLAFYAMSEFIRQHRAWQAAVFCGSCVLGFLAHLTFLYAYLALVIWSAWSLVKTRGISKQYLAELLACQSIPLTFFAFLYFADLRYQLVGGINPSSWSEAGLRALALSVGGPAAGWPAYLAAALAAGLAVVALAQMRAEKSEDWIFYLIAIFAAPVLLAGLRFQRWHERYFIVNAAFLLLLLARLAARAWEAGGWRRRSAAVLLLVSLTGSGIHAAALLRYGRGDYSGTLRFMVRHTRGSMVTVASDHNFRNPMLLAFYSDYVVKKLAYYTPGPWPLSGLDPQSVALYADFITRKLDYHADGQWPPLGPEWFIRHSLRQDSLPRQIIIESDGSRFTLVKPTEPAGLNPKGKEYRFTLVRTARYAGLSGCFWFLYHNDEFEWYPAGSSVIP